MIDSRLPLNLAGAAVAVGLIAILAFLTWALIYTRVPTDNREALTVLIGILSANVGQLVSFFFGSSVTNHRKDEAIEKQASTIQAAQAALTPTEAIPVSPGESVTVEGKSE